MMSSADRLSTVGRRAQRCRGSTRCRPASRLHRGQAHPVLPRVRRSVRAGKEKAMSKSWIGVLAMMMTTAARETGRAEGAVPARNAYVTRLDGMETMSAGKGEVIHLLRGESRGFEN